MTSAAGSAAKPSSRHLWPLDDHALSPAYPERARRPSSGTLLVLRPPRLAEPPAPTQTARLRIQRAIEAVLPSGFATHRPGDVGGPAPLASTTSGPKRRGGSSRNPWCGAPVSGMAPCGCRSKIEQTIPCALPGLAGTDQHEEGDGVTARLGCGAAGGCVTSVRPLPVQEMWMVFAFSFGFSSGAAVKLPLEVTTGVVAVGEVPWSLSGRTVSSTSTPQLTVSATTSTTGRSVASRRPDPDHNGRRGRLPPAVSGVPPRSTVLLHLLSNSCSPLSPSAGGDEKRPDLHGPWLRAPLRTAPWNTPCTSGR
jgi:hypothetical protein